MTSATEIRFKSLSKEGDYGFVELVDVDPEDFKIAGFDDGLSLSYGSEVYMEDYGGIIEPKEDTRIITEVWFGEDPWATIKKLDIKLETIKELIQKWREEIKEYPETPEGLFAKVAVGLCSNELDDAFGVHGLQGSVNK